MILSEPIERAVQVYPLFVHDDRDDVEAAVSGRLLDVIRTCPGDHCQTYP